MNRQEAVLAITKINRIVKQLNYWCDLNVAIDLSVFGDNILHLDEWTTEVHAYLSENPDRKLLGLVEEIGSTSLIEDYLANKGDTLPKEVSKSLQGYVVAIHKIQTDCEALHQKTRGKYTNLPDHLANGKAADLLGRAVKAGILDKEYQPTEKASYAKLKVMAFAISQLMCFDKRHTYLYFDQLWCRGGYHISSVSLPRTSNKTYADILELYPEVDFSGLVKTYNGFVFNSPFDDKRKKALLKALIYNGYVDPATKPSHFLGIFDEKTFKHPVNWLREQRLLAYFVKHAFGPTNTKNLWVKAASCFLVDGKTPHKESLVTGYNAIARNGQADTYNTYLKNIADEYNMDANSCARSTINN